MNRKIKSFFIPFAFLLSFLLFFFLFLSLFFFFFLFVFLSFSFIHTARLNCSQLSVLIFLWVEPSDASISVVFYFSFISGCCSLLPGSTRFLQCSCSLKLSRNDKKQTGQKLAFGMYVMPEVERAKTWWLQMGFFYKIFLSFSVACMGLYGSAGFGGK